MQIPNKLGYIVNLENRRIFTDLFEENGTNF